VRRIVLTLPLALLGAAAAGCASAPRPETQLAVTREDGRVVPLDSTTTEFTVGGVRVIHRANFATDVVAAHLYLLGGTRQLTPRTQGVEPLLLQAAEYGSAAYPGAALRAAWGATGSQLAIDPDVDWTLYAFRGIRAEFDSSWNVFADRLAHPTLAKADVDRARARLVGRLRLRRADPDGLATLLADSVAYQGHPYALRPSGTEASLAALDSAALARYAAEQLVQSRMLLVVVGGVDRATVEAAVARTLAKLPRGSYAWSLPPAPNVTRPAAGGPAAGGAVAYVTRPSATNYVLGVFQGPSASAPDAPAFRLATALLSGRLHSAVREKRGLSYAAYAMYFDRGATAAGLYMSTTAPDTALGLAKTQIKALQTETYPAAAMQFFARQFVTEYIGSNLTSSAQADFLAHAALYQGDFRAAARDLDALRGVSGYDVRVAATRYLTRARFVYVGDTSRVRRETFDRF
jgi:zinc protease